jgi:hypothetical protein
MPGPNRPRLPFQGATFNSFIWDESAPISASSVVRTVEHQCHPEPRTRNMQEALRREMADQYRSRHMDPGLVTLPRTLVQALGDELHRLSTQTIRLRVADDPLAGNRVQPPAPSPAPPVTGISPEHLELLRKVVAAGVEWDMMSDEEGGALLESVAAVKPTAGARPEPGTTPTGRIQGSFNPEDYLRSAMTSANTSTIRNTTATEMLAQMDEVQRQLAHSPSLSGVHNISFEDIERMHAEIARGIPAARSVQQAIDEEVMRQATASAPRITPDAMRSENEDPRPRPPYPLVRSRFGRPGGR